MCSLYCFFYIEVPMFKWLIGDDWHKYRAFSNDFWNTGNFFFHLATYRAFLLGFGIPHLIASFVFLKKFRYKLLSVFVFLFQFFMVLHKSFIAELLLLGTYIFLVSFFLEYKSRSLGNTVKRVVSLCAIVIPILFLANKQRTHVAKGSASLFVRYIMNAGADLFILSSKHSLFECKHWDAVSHSFKKIFNLKTPGFSLGRQLYVDIYGYKKSGRG